MPAQKTVTLPHGLDLPALGQGTWYMGEDPAARAAELAALRTGLDLGMTVIDTAEMYGSGAAEELVGEAVAGRRDEAYLVSKVLPYNASRSGTIEACHASLRRLGTERIDLYLLHWPGPYALAETVDAFEALVAEGSIGAWGLSNFDVDDLTRLQPSHAAGKHPGPQVNQVLYNLTRRGPEYDLLPWCRERGLPVMAYSPIEQGRLLGEQALATVAAAHDATAAQIALAWTLRAEGVLAIPKAADVDHVRQNRAALDLELTDHDHEILDAAFAPPAAKEPLAIL